MEINVEGSFELPPVPCERLTIRYKGVFEHLAVLSDYTLAQKIILYVDSPIVNLWVLQNTKVGRLFVTCEEANLHSPSLTKLETLKVRCTGKVIGLTKLVISNPGLTRASIDVRGKKFRLKELANALSKVRRVRFRYVLDDPLPYIPDGRLDVPDDGKVDPEKYPIEAAFQTLYGTRGKLIWHIVPVGSLVTVDEMVRRVDYVSCLSESHRKLTVLWDEPPTAKVLPFQESEVLTSEVVEEEQVVTAEVAAEGEETDEGKDMAIDAPHKATEAAEATEAPKVEEEEDADTLDEVEVEDEDGVIEPVSTDGAAVERNARIARDVRLLLGDMTIEDTPEETPPPEEPLEVAAPVSQDITRN